MENVESVADAILKDQCAEQKPVIDCFGRNQQERAWETMRRNKADLERYEALSASEKRSLSSVDKERYLYLKSHVRKGKYKKRKSLKVYDGVRKAIFRDKVVEYFSFVTQYLSSSVTTLALESQDGFFVNKLPDHDFVIYEKDPAVYALLMKLQKSTPNIKELINGDIELAKNSKYEFDYAFLDFCTLYQSNEEKLYALSKVLDNTLYIALTFALRGHKKEQEDYKFELIKKLQDIFRNHTIEDMYPYRDGAPMIGFVLKNREWMDMDSANGFVFKK